MKPDFFKSATCLSGHHCKTCRNMDTGRPLRESWGRIYNIGDSVDFACPYNRTGSEPPSLAKRPASLGVKIDEVRRAFAQAQCASCENKVSEQPGDLLGDTIVKCRLIKCCGGAGPGPISHAFGQCPIQKFPKAQNQGVVAKVMHGASGIAKAILGIDQAPQEVILERRAICAGCPSKTTKMGLEVCKTCDCHIGAKTSLRAESCPEKRWFALPILT